MTDAPDFTNHDDTGPVATLPPVPPLMAVPPPPDLTDADGDGDDDGDHGVHVHVSVTVLGKHRSITLYFPEVPDDQEFAEELYGATSAVARLHGRGVWFEMERRCAESGHAV